MPKVHFLNEAITVTVPAGSNLLDVAEQNGIQIYRGMWPHMNCGGRGLCGRCGVWVPRSEGASGRTLFERFRRVQGELRLACRVRVMGDVEVRTRPIGPAYLTTVKKPSDLGEAAYKQTAALRYQEALAEEKAKEEAAKKAAAQKAAEEKKKKAEAEKAKAEAEKAEAEKAKAEAEKAKAEDKAQDPPA